MVLTKRHSVSRAVALPVVREWKNFKSTTKVQYSLQINKLLTKITKKLSILSPPVSRFEADYLSENLVFASEKSVLHNAWACSRQRLREVSLHSRLAKDSNYRFFDAF